MDIMHLNTRNDYVLDCQPSYLLSNAITDIDGTSCEYDSLVRLVM